MGMAETIHITPPEVWRLVVVDGVESEDGVKIEDVVEVEDGSSPDSRAKMNSPFNRFGWKVVGGFDFCLRSTLPGSPSKQACEGG